MCKGTRDFRRKGLRDKSEGAGGGGGRKVEERSGVALDCQC